MYIYLYTGIYELERKIKSEVRAVHKTYAKQINFLAKIYNYMSKLFCNQREGRGSYKLQNSLCPWDQTGLKPEVQRPPVRLAQLGRVEDSHRDLEPPCSTEPTDLMSRTGPCVSHMHVTLHASRSDLQRWQMAGQKVKCSGQEKYFQEQH